MSDDDESGGSNLTTEKPGLGRFCPILNLFEPGIIHVPTVLSTDGRLLESKRLDVFDNTM